MSSKGDNRVFAIGDIHGCAKTFRRLLFEELAVTTDDMVICIGDYIDRGPDSKGVVDTILEMRESGHEIVTLRGNHEQIMLDSGHGLESYFLWHRNGGDATLQSFGVTTYDDLGMKYRTFFEDTIFWYAWENYILAHAGLNFDAADPLSDREAMLWTRDTQVDKSWLGDRIVVHGHTPVPKDVILEQEGHNINIDGGCVYPYREGLGYLVALELRSRRYVVIENIDMR